MQRYDWSLVDPLLADPARAAVAQRLMDLVRSGWTADVQFDLEEASTQSFLFAHRVSTLIPTDRIIEHQRETFHEQLVNINGVQLRIEATAKDVVERLRSAGIDSRVLKGNASASLDYPSPNYRQTGDVDLAIPLDQFDACLRVFDTPDFGDYKSLPKTSHRLKGTTVVAANGIEIDIHTRLFVRSEPSTALFAAPGASVPSMAASALPTEQRLVHAAGHFMLAWPGSRRFSGLVDVTMIRDRYEVDYDKVLRFAQALNVAGPVGAALRLEAALSQRAEAISAAWPSLGWVDQKTLLADERRLGIEYLARFRDVPKARRLSYVGTWLKPTAREWQILRNRLRRS